MWARRSSVVRLEEVGMAVKVGVGDGRRGEGDENGDVHCLDL